MNDDVAAIDQYPFTGLLTLNAVDPATMFLYFIHHVFRQGFGLPRRIRAGYCDVVENGRKFGNVNQFDVARFNVFKRIDDDGRQFFGSQLMLTPWLDITCVAQYNRKRHQA